MANVDFDASSFFKGVGQAITKAVDASNRGVKAVADEILRLSQHEVPHGKGLLQNSGHTEPGEEGEEIVGYNKVYAARLHEHPEYRFQKGRKGKYLEDPITRNLNVFLKFLGVEVEKEF